MLQPKKIDRKQKRVIKRYIILSLIGLGAVFVVAGVTFYVIVWQMNKPLFVSPLASIQFAQAAQKDNQLDILKQQLTKQQIDYTSITKPDDSSFVIELSKGGKVTISSQKDIIAQIASLQYILSHLTMEGRQFTQLDLRFEKPVIVVK